MTSDEYWSLDIPGLTAEQAQSLRDRLGSEFDYGVIPVDPRHWLTRHFDRGSVETLVQSLHGAIAAGALPDADLPGAQGLLEDCEAWLRQAAN